MKKEEIYREMVKRYNNIKPDRKKLIDPTEEDLLFFYHERNIVGIAALLWAEAKKKGINLEIL